ncbi:hemin uptake protein HemP [Undibacterium arcticum]|uniref:Hemin uptake protein HemP n=1 Tax=Undibacterium arcticum TaxID=1762892 RepID=A0ABV7EXG4_9BURK
MSKSPPLAPNPPLGNPAPSRPAPLHRISSQELFQQAREVEIDHEGRIYRLRMTSLNKLILTA